MFLEKHVDKQATHSPQVTRAADLILDGCDLRFKDWSSIDDEDDATINVRRFVFVEHLSTPSHAQFVELGVKEAKQASLTDRSEEMRSCHGVVRSAHVADAGNSRSGPTSQEMIFNRTNAATAAANDHVALRQDDSEGCQLQFSVVICLLRLGHFKQVRVDLNKERIDERATDDKNVDKAQQEKPQMLTAAVTGHVLFDKVVQSKHMADLDIESMERGVPIEELPETVAERKLWLQESEIFRSMTEEGLSEDEAEDIGRKQFEVLSDADFGMDGSA